MSIPCRTFPAPGAGGKAARRELPDMRLRAALLRVRNVGLMETADAPDAVLAVSGAAVATPTPGLCGAIAARLIEARWRYTPHLIVFYSSACIMVIELVAGRLIARHVGASLYTWTAIIGVVLAGMSAGNVIGGRLADRWKPEALLPWLFVIGAGACVASLGINAIFAATRPLKGLAWPVQILLSVLVIFILPALSLGTISPAAAKMAVGRARNVGTAIGSFYACGAAGSILGTLLTGFYLVDLLGATRLVLSVAGGLILAGLCAGPLRAFFNSLAPLPPEAAAEPPAAPMAETARAADDVEETLKEANGAAEWDPIFAWRYTPHAIVFFSAACLMIVEMLASRVISRQTGSSLYTWTSVIGVVLGGMVLGNYIGGRLADCLRARTFVGWLFMCSSVACVGIVLLSHTFWMSTPLKGLMLPYALTSPMIWCIGGLVAVALLSSIVLPRRVWAVTALALCCGAAYLALYVSYTRPQEEIRWPGVIFLTVTAIFFLPSVLLGMFSPVATKLALERPGGVGRTIGTISAWQTAGSIIGTLAAGYLLVSAFGTKGLSLVVACALAVGGLITGPWRGCHAFWTAILITTLLISRGALAPGMNLKVQEIFQQKTSTDLFATDSNYQYIRVYRDDGKSDEKGGDIRVLALDYLIHGYVNVDDPTHLEYDYEQVYQAIVRRMSENRPPERIFFLGGGSYTFPRWAQVEWPKCQIKVAEIDPLVVEANYQALGLPRDTAIRTVTMDARNAVDDLPAGEQYDFFFGDAFNDLSTPFHLTTVEFARMVSNHLKDDGAFLVNIIDSYDSALLLGCYTASLQQVFPHTYVFCTEPTGVKGTRDTFIVAACKKPLDTTGWTRNHSTSFCGSLLTDEEMAAIMQRCGRRILTDDDAPVENLIAPVLRLRKQ
jgi:spermidine synthase